MSLILLPPDERSMLPFLILPTYTPFPAWIFIITLFDVHLMVAVPPIANPSASDPEEIASHIKYHAEFSPCFSPFKFELKQAYMATAQSVRDTLVQRWNETYKHMQNTNAKTIHYLSMEFLQVDWDVDTLLEVDYLSFEMLCGLSIYWIMHCPVL